MIARISDQRILDARLTGEIAGMTTDAVLYIVLTADLLLEVETWSDAHFMFEGFTRHHGSTFKVPVTGFGWMLFDWMDGLGPVNIRLHE